MDPITLSLITSLGPVLLGKLGLFGKDPQAELRKKLAGISNPQNLRTQTQQFYQQFLQSPAFSQAQGSIAAGANRAGGQVAQSMAQRGIGTSGVGAVVPALQSSLVGSQLGGLQAAGYGQAQDMAQKSIQDQIQALIGGGSGPSQGQQLFGSGMSAFSNFLLPYLLNKQGIDPSGVPRDSINWLQNNPQPLPARRGVSP